MEHFNLDSIPPLTVAIPTYNEAANIERVVTQFLQTSYPHLREVLVVDGGSSDGTQAIVAQLAQQDMRVRLLHNPHTIQSAALNIAIAEAQGDIVLRADAHSDYAPDYIEQCVQAMIETNAWNVGGSQRFVAKTPFQAGVALAVQSVLGSGGAKYRNPNYNGYADTVYLGCFNKHALESLDRAHLRPTVYSDSQGQQHTATSFFDLDQVTNQDAELNLCLTEQNPQAIYVSSAIQVWYYPRKTWLRLVKQYMNYGRGRCRTVQNHARTSPLRGRLPFLVLAMATLTFIIDTLFLRRKLHTDKFLLAGVCIPVLEGMRVTWKYRETFDTDIWRGDPNAMPTVLERWLYCSMALLTKPPAHFIGYAYQLYRMKVLGIRGW